MNAPQVNPEETNRQSPTRGGRPFVDGAFLKILAIVTMLIDHITAVYGSTSMVPLGTGYQVGRGIGRIAFPIFCFLLAEGFYYTRSRWKYLGRLLIFAAVSELSFDMAFSGTLIDPTYQNVFFTLFFGGLAITLLQLLEGDRGRGREAASPTPKNPVLRFLLILAVVLGCAIGAELLDTDYGAGGVCTIIVMYVLSERKKPEGDLFRIRVNNTRGFALGVLMLGLTCGTIEFLAAIDIIFIWFYNGRRGMQLKYFFYAFYPVHLFIIALIFYGTGVFNVDYLTMLR
ncbi:MAG: TraX family protein [Lachnospiraceae bacterium]|nr:TraX family protein [Lachnospiraceae bacterium]